MAGPSLLCLLLAFPLSSSQITLPTEKEPHILQAAPPPAAPIQNLLGKQENIRLNAKQTYVHADKGDAKVGLFIAAAVGTFLLMAAVYCIYNKFYTKQQYLHTQLHQDADPSSDPSGPAPVFFHASSGSGDARRFGYGSLSDAPSVISVPPGLSPPPSSMPFPPLFLSSPSLRTISAKDLQRSYI